ncbi:hypothetical protein ABFA07_012225 [Porites harrisoni]
MEVELNARSKRHWEDSLDGETVETAQVKFKRLLERNQGFKYASLNSMDEIKNVIFKLVDDNRSFEGIIRESEDISNIGTCDSWHQEPSKLESFSVLTADSCVDFLKCQATKASCPLDLLAAESMAKRLISVCKPASQQLLAGCQLDSVLSVVKVIKQMLAEQCFNRVYFAKHLTSKGPCLPLEVVWLLHKDCIVSFDTYLACCFQCDETVEVIPHGLLSLCTNITNKEKQGSILSVLLGRLISFSFLENKTKEGPVANNRLEKITQDIMDIVVEKSDFLLCRKMDCPPQEESKERFCVLEIVRRLNDIPWPAIRKFFSRQLNLFFMQQPDADTPKLDSRVFCKQKDFKFSMLNQTARTVIEQFLLIFDPMTLIECLKDAVFKDQVNVPCVLSFLSSFVVLVKEAASMIEGYVNDLLNESLNNNDSHSLLIAFVMVRQMSLEGGHVFKPYVMWFQGYFGDQGNLKLNTKKSVQFFIKFLSELVPYEPAEYLKVHIIKAPQVPSKLRELVTDYASLAKTRLMDLKEPVELVRMYGDGSAGTEAKSEHAKQLEQASSDVDKVLDAYEKSGKVPSTVMEASIFRKPYFIGRFLPALLTPRKIPDEPDTRSQLIDVLSKAGKIPKNMLTAYQSACKKTTEQIEVNVLDDEGTLSGMEKLISCLEKLTRLIVESLQFSDLSKLTGRISSQLSIISATIQSMTKASDEMLITNQLVEVDIVSLDRGSCTQTVDALLDAFYRTCDEVKKCSLDSLDNMNRYHWVRDFVAMVVCTTSLHKSLYCQLWRRTCLQGVTSSNQDVQGLAVILCYLCINQTNMLPVLLRGNLHTAEKKFPDVCTICCFLDVLCDHIPLCTSRWMEFFLRFSCTYMDHVLDAFSGSFTEIKTDVGLHTAYLSPAMLRKTFYLLHRLNVCGDTFLFKPTLPEDLVCMVKKLISVQQFQQLKEKEEKLTFSEWCRWELGVSAREDFLSDDDRRIYHQFRVLDHFLPLGTLDGGCNGCASKACSVIFHALLNAESRSLQEQKRLDISRNDMINLIQELVTMLPQLSNDDAGQETEAESSCDPWLLQQFHSRMSQVQFNVEQSKTKTTENCDLLPASKTASFIKLAMRLPPYLLFTNKLDSDPNAHSITRVADFIYSYLRPYLSDGGCLPFDITTYILKALLTYTRTSPSKSITTGSELFSRFFKECPLFFVSTQHYWKQLRPLAASHRNYTCAVLQQAGSFLNWKNRVETAQNASLSELEGFDVYVLASAIAVYLRGANRVMMNLIVEEMKAPTEFTRKLAGCLFDCIVAEFSQMLLHGNEIEENAVLRDFAWQLLRCFPRTLLVFKIDENCEFKDDVMRLRSLILKEHLIKLYPAVFFSFFTNFSREALCEMTKMRGFLEVTLSMYNSFVFLRKECLEGVANKTAVCSPLHLDFCRQVSVFVRDCVLSSSGEQLRSLTKDVISSCTSELRQFLQSQLSKVQER